MTRYLIPRLGTLVFALGAAMPAMGQVAPDAGRALQELAPPLEMPKPSTGISIEAPPPAPIPPGGARVTLQTVSFEGNTLFSEQQLLVVLADFADHSHDLAGLRGLASRVSDFYRQAGYPFARAYLPPQPLSDGRLKIAIIEGQYGAVRATGDDAFALGAQAFLVPLRTGDVIETRLLERTTLLIEDLPGIRVTPILRPGDALGAGDLDVAVRRDRRFGGSAGLDNHGNRYSGAYRARLDLQADSPFLFGDQIEFRSLLTDEKMWLGSLAYSLPLGGSGLRGQIGYAHMSYELGKDFASLDSTGTARVSSVAVTYPIIRSLKRNLTLGTTWQHKELRDKQGATDTDSDKHSDSLPINLNFDARDSLGGGGITYGAVTWMPGRLGLDHNLVLVDQATARTEGNFHKLNLDVARLQVLSGGLSLYGRLSGQWADKNLDSSEGFGLGGPNGVRAYPVSEAYGDKGWLAQVELRHDVGSFSPYVFYDGGRITVNAKPWDAVDNHRHIAGAGLGMRYLQQGWNLDAALAWRTEGGTPQSVTQDKRPRAWVTAGYAF